MEKLNRKNTLIACFLILGAVLSIIQFFSDRGIWLDEAAICLNLIERSALDLLKPLSYNGVAPIAFLEIQKGFISIWPKADYALRILPFICYLAALALFTKILVRLFNNTATIVFCISAIIFNQTAIYYSGEAKQYMPDLFVAVALYYLLLKYKTQQNGSYLFLAIAGICAVWLSNITPIIFLTANLFMLYKSGSVQKFLKKETIVLNLLWGLSFAVYFFLFIYNHPTKLKMQDHWLAEGSFMPFDMTFGTWFYGRLHGVFYYLFYFGTLIGSIIAALYLVGLYAIIFVRKNYGLLVLTIAPPVTHIILSGLKLYPFEIRLYLYIMPMIVLVCGFGYEYIIDKVNLLFKNKHIWIIKIAYLFILPLIMLRVILIHPFPFTQHDDSKRCINYVNGLSQPGDALYVTDLTGFPVKYYNELGLVKNMSTIAYENPLIPPGTESKINLEKLRLVKKRLWIFSYPKALANDRFVFNYLIKNNFIKSKTYTSAGGVNVYLYEKL